MQRSIRVAYLIREIERGLSKQWAPSEILLKWGANTDQTSLVKLFMIAYKSILCLQMQIINKYLF